MVGADTHKVPDLQTFKQQVRFEILTTDDSILQLLPNNFYNCCSYTREKMFSNMNHLSWGFYKLIALKEDLQLTSYQQNKLTSSDSNSRD